MTRANKCLSKPCMSGLSDKESLILAAKATDAVYYHHATGEMNPPEGLKVVETFDAKLSPFADECGKSMAILFQREGLHDYIIAFRGVSKPEMACEVEFIFKQNEEPFAFYPGLTESGVGVTQGLNMAYAALQEQIIKKYLDLQATGNAIEKITIVGHSLGSNMAELHGLDLIHYLHSHDSKLPEFGVCVFPIAAPNGLSQGFIDLYKQYIYESCEVGAYTVNNSRDITIAIHDHFKPKWVVDSMPCSKYITFGECDSKYNHNLVNYTTFMHDQIPEDLIVSDCLGSSVDVY